MTLLLVHLVRGQNGPRPFREFLDSYARRPAGITHDLLLALKGFASEHEARACLEAASDRGVVAHHMVLPDDGVDLTAYARVVQRAPADRYCFVNSFSRVLADDWLARLAGALDRAEIGVAGATGSWASQRDYRRYHLGLASGYDRVLDSRESTRKAFLELTRAHQPDKRDNGRLAFKAVAALALLRERGAFDGFPARHLRTNAFVASREMMLRLGFPQIRGKRQAYRFESGRANLTVRVRGMGLEAVVIGRDGSVYEPEKWHQSLTFWQGAQENLLVADNQTEDYAHADPARRELLSRLAWGEQARPAQAGEHR